jgi:DNA modification methylase
VNELTIDISKITVKDYHRAVKPFALNQIIQSIKNHDYNIAYPITIDKDLVLVDGRHRLEAMRTLGYTEIPYIYKPDDISHIKFGLQCNADGQLSQADDVFDLAELCWNLSKAGWTGQQIADELGWGLPEVSKYKSIKGNLHKLSWSIARFPINVELGNEENETVGNPNFPKGNCWSERVFRALLQYLSYTDGDKAVMRMQIKAIREIIARATEKDKRFGQTQKTVTAKWVGELASKYAWYIRLAVYMRDNLVKEVKIRDRVSLLRNVYKSVWGDGQGTTDDKVKENEEKFIKFTEAVKKLNEKALGVILYHDDSFQRVPLLKDGSISLVVTDPPYNVTDHEWDRIGTDEEFMEFTEKWLLMIKPKLCEDYQLFFFCDPDYVAEIERILVDNKFPLRSRVIWWNRSLPSGRNTSDRFASTWQMIFHCGTHDLNWNPDWSDERFDVQSVSAPNSNTKDGGYHPTPKPVKLLEHLITIGSKPMDIVLDLFAGGGATGEACANITQRRCILIEKSDTFCCNIEKRLKINREVE